MKRTSAASDPSRFEFLIFFTGGIVLSLEVLASRIMTPFFGVSLYIWAGILSTTLAFLAIGYLLGGRVSSRHGIQALLPLFLAAPVIAALWISVAAATYPALFLIFSKASLVGGSFAAATLLLAPPLIVLSAMNPVLVAIMRERRTFGDSGAGRVFFISTAGSVAGVILTAFVLIPYSTNFRSLLFLALAVSLIVSVMSFGWPGLSRRNKIQIFAGCAVAALLSSALLTWQRPYLRAMSELMQGPAGTFQVRAEYSSIYGNLKVVDVFLPGDPENPTRFLVQDGLIQNRATLQHESMSMYTYVLDYLARSFEPDARTALVLGLGAGMVPRHLRDRGLQVSVVEINKDTLQAATDYFGFSQDDFKMYWQDARTFARRCPKKFDVIVVDLFWGDNTPDYLLTAEFFGDLQKCLQRPGSIVMNAFLDEYETLPNNRLRATIATAFPRLFEFQAPAANTFIVGKVGRRTRKSPDAIQVPTKLSPIVNATLISGRPVTQFMLRSTEPVTDDENNFSVLFADANLRIRKHFLRQFPLHVLIN